MTQLEKDTHKVEKGTFALFDSLLEGCQIIDRDWRYIYLNEMAITHARKQADELIGFTMMEAYPGIETSPLFDILEAVKDGGEAQRLENEFTYPDGRVGWYELQVQSYLDYILILSRDVTESKLALQNSQLQLKRLNTLRQIDLAITSSVDLHVITDVILERIRDAMHVDAAIILLYNQYSLWLETLQMQGMPNMVDSYGNVKLGEGVAGKVALDRQTRVITDISSAEEFKRKQLIEDGGFKSYVAAPLVAKGRTLGVLELFNRQPFAPDDDWMNYFEIVAGQVAIAIESVQTFNQLQSANTNLVVGYENTIEGWAKTLELRKIETEGHSQREVELAEKLGHSFGYTEEQLVNLRRGALLHDIGKIALPDEILFKPGKLNDEEWVEMKRHPVIAHQLLSRIEFLSGALEIPYYHHEKWDGTGYPMGLKGTIIPHAARLFAIVDVWGAMNSERPYRPALPREEIIAYIENASGTHFDPDVVQHFLRVVDQ